MLKQIGNAVPPLLAFAVGRMAMAVLEAAEGKIQASAASRQMPLLFALPAIHRLQPAQAMLMRASA
jgi:hypothetical protein